MGDRGSRGQYSKTVEVRARIIRAAVAVFAEDGFQAATMRRIAQGADLSERGLGHHFGSKEMLLRAVIEDHEAAVAAAVGKTRGLDALRSMLEVVAEDRAHRAIVEMHSMLSAEASSPQHPAHAHYNERYRDGRLFATMAFQSLRDQGRLTSPLAPHQLGAAFIALSDGLQLQWLYDPQGVDHVSILNAFLDSAVSPAPELLTTNSTPAI